jgi:hypothetical protein
MVPRAKLPMINQIRELQARRPFQRFALELSSAHVIQIHDPYCVATDEGSAAKVGILHGDSFELISVDHIVSVSVGVHPTEEEGLRNFRAQYAPSPDN